MKKFILASVVSLFTMAAYAQPLPPLTGPLFPLNSAGNPNMGTFVSPLLGLNGNAAAPAYSFSLDHNSGLYSCGTGCLGFTVNGNNVMTVNPNGAVTHFANVIAENANYVINPNQSATEFTNFGTAAAITGTLPQCTAANVGMNVRFTIASGYAFAQQVLFNAADIVSAPGISQTTKTALYSPTTAGATIGVGCYAVGLWRITSAPTGTWTGN
jgi:hypothetical protein